MFIYTYFYVCSVRSVCSVSLCSSVNCLCVNVYGSTDTGCQPITVNKIYQYQYIVISVLDC